MCDLGDTMRLMETAQGEDPSEVLDIGRLAGN